MHNQKPDVMELRRQVRAKVDALPQRDLIEHHDARFWTEEVVERYGDLALWHATRAGGFGGSQIGALVRNYMGLRADHSSAHDIVEGTLLRRLPDEPNGPMRRGVFMEPHHREMFYAKWGARRDEAGFNLLSQSTGSRRWARYSPDELCFMSGAVLGLPAVQPVRILGDFKAPTEAHGVNFEYQCQLAMGNAICSHVGVKVDALMLSQLDWANWELRDEWVDSSQELEDLIFTAGDHYWDEFVMKGMVPPYVHKPRLDPASDVVQALTQPLTMLARMKSLGAYVTKRVEELEAQVKPKLKELRFGDSKLVIGGMSYSASHEVDAQQAAKVLPVEVMQRLPLKKRSTKRYDEDKLLAAVKELAPDADLKQFLQPDNLDPEAVRAALEEAGADPDAIVTEKLTGRVDRGVTEQTMVWAQAHIGQLVGDAQRAVDALASLPGGEDEEDDREGQSSLRHVPGSRS